MRRVILLTLLLTAGCGRVDRGRMFANETAAIRRIQTIHTAQAQYFAQFGKFAGTLGELGPSVADLIPRDLASGEKGGYRYNMTAQASGYVLHAAPVKSGSTGLRTFYSDQTLLIREHSGPEPATATSPEVK